MNLTARSTMKKSLAPEPIVRGLPLGSSHLRAVPSDEALVARARARDTAAFEELLGRYQEKLHRLAMRFVHNPTDAQEILQDVYLSVWRKLPAFEGRAQIGSWLYRVTVNASLMFLRARSRHPEVAMADVDPGVLGVATGHAGFAAGADWSRKPDEQLQSGELRRQIQQAVDELPVGLRSVFLVRDVEGCSTRETAHSLGLTRPAVKTRLHRARAALRENMHQYMAG